MTTRPRRSKHLRPPEPLKNRPRQVHTQTTLLLVIDGSLLTHCLCFQSWLVARCPFHYFHVNPKTNQRESYTEVDNQHIFEAQTKGQPSIQISEGYEVRFGDNAKSSKMPKVSRKFTRNLGTVARGL